MGSRASGVQSGFQASLEYSEIFVSKEQARTSEMSQLVKTLATKPDSLNSVLRTTW